MGSNFKHVIRDMLLHSLQCEQPFSNRLASETRKREREGGREREGARERELCLNFRNLSQYKDCFSREPNKVLNIYKNY